jgi:hypothetical protein
LIKARRFFFITLWTFAAFWAWMGANLLSLRLLVNAQASGRVRPLAAWLPEWMLVTILPALFVGAFVVTLGALLLGMRGRLPGTPKATDQVSGFEVSAAPPPEL